MVMIVMLRWFKTWLSWAYINDNGNDFDEFGNGDDEDEFGEGDDEFGDGDDEFGDGDDEDECDYDKPGSVEPPSPSSALLPRQHLLDLQIMMMSPMIIIDW